MCFFIFILFFSTIEASPLNLGISIPSDNSLSVSLDSSSDDSIWGYGLSLPIIPSIIEKKNGDQTSLITGYFFKVYGTYVLHEATDFFWKLRLSSGFLLEKENFFPLLGSELLFSHTFDNDSLISFFMAIGLNFYPSATSATLPTLEIGYLFPIFP